MFVALCIHGEIPLSTLFRLPFIRILNHERLYIM
jgi:hypothetical protein